MGILISIIIIIAVILFIIFVGYVKSPPDTAYLISGFRKPRVLIGKAGIRIPFLERLFLNEKESEIIRKAQAAKEANDAKVLSEMEIAEKQTSLAIRQAELKL